MLCSECSRVVRPVVVVDIDGTLADYHDHFLRFLEEYLGVEEHPRSYDGAISFKQFCVYTYGITGDVWSDIKLAYRQGGQKRTMPIFDWAQVLTGVVRWEGAELWIATTRPYLRLDNIDPDTRAWIDRNHIEYDHLIYDKYKYRVLSEQVDPNRVIAVLDDLPHKHAEARTCFGTAVPILKGSKYNKKAASDPPLLVMWDLKDITVEIVRRIHKWKELHP